MHTVLCFPVFIVERKLVILCFLYYFFVAYFTAPIDGDETSAGAVHAEESEDSDGNEIGT